MVYTINDTAGKPIPRNRPKNNMKPPKKKTLKDFKLFLAENCYNLHAWSEGKYTRKIYEWFITPPKRK